MADAKNANSECRDIKRTVPELVTQEELEKITGPTFKLLPTFEKTLYEVTYIKHYSLNSNELLKCNWEKYKRNIETKVMAPFQFLDIRDYHFYNCKNRLKPSESVHTKTNFRFQLRPGPGVDAHGQLPIPQELHMQRGSHKVIEKKKNETKGGLLTNHRNVKMEKDK